MKLNFHNAIWRSRAIAILGFVIMLIIIFPGLPSALKTTFLLALGFAITGLGFAGSRRHAYVSTDESEMLIAAEEKPVPPAEGTEPVVIEEAIVFSLPEKEDE